MRQLNGDGKQDESFAFQGLNTPLKHTDGKGNFKRMLSFLQVDKGRLFFIKLSFVEFKIHEIFITADRSAWPVWKRHQAQATQAHCVSLKWP